MDNLYEALRIPRTATAAEVRTAYRRIAIKHHPDRSKDPKSIPVFKRATEAYEILGDPERRKVYDVDLGLQLKRKAEAARKSNPFPNPGFASPSSATPPASTQRVNLTEDIGRLSVLFSRGRTQEAEAMARAILAQDERQPVPYAVLGDLARTRGEHREAARMYSFAIQMDPRNELYQRRYDESLDQVPAERTKQTQPESHRIPFAVASLIIVACVVGAALLHDRPDLSKLSIVSSWTYDLMLLLFLAGISFGSGLSASRWTDRLSSATMSSQGVATPLSALSIVALLNFWLALVLFALGSLGRGAFPYSSGRVFFGVAVTTLLFGAASSLGSFQPLQTILWGGNIIYLGALLGWIGADIFR